MLTEDDARHYDDDVAYMFSEEVIGPTVDFLAELAGSGPALELAIGTGRVAIPLSDRGVEVAGIELSEPMVEGLRAKVPADRIPVVLGDMARATGPPPGPGRFQLVFLVYNTITNLLTQDEQVACFANAARHLQPGGSFVIECFVPPLRRLAPGQTSIPFDVSDHHLGFDTYDLVNQRVVSHHIHSRGGEVRRTASHHRYVWPAELDLMARLAGMELVRRVATWRGEPFTDASTSHVSVWRTPD